MTFVNISIYIISLKWKIIAHEKLVLNPKTYDFWTTDLLKLNKCVKQVKGIPFISYTLVPDCSFDSEFDDWVNHGIVQEGVWSLRMIWVFMIRDFACG